MNFIAHFHSIYRTAQPLANKRNDTRRENAHAETPDRTSCVLVFLVFILVKNSFKVNLLEKRNLPRM